MDTRIAGKSFAFATRCEHKTTCPTRYPSRSTCPRVLMCAHLQLNQIVCTVIKQAAQFFNYYSISIIMRVPVSNTIGCAEMANIYFNHKSMLKSGFRHLRAKRVQSGRRRIKMHHRLYKYYISVCLFIIYDRFAYDNCLPRRRRTANRVRELAQRICWISSVISCIRSISVCVFVVYLPNMPITLRPQSFTTRTHANAALKCRALA